MYWWNILVRELKNIGTTYTFVVKCKDNSFSLAFDGFLQYIVIKLKWNTFYTGQKISPYYLYFYRIRHFEVLHRVPYAVFGFCHMWAALCGGFSTRENSYKQNVYIYCFVPRVICHRFYFVQRYCGMVNNILWRIVFVIYGLFPIGSGYWYPKLIYIGGYSFNEIPYYSL